MLKRVVGLLLVVAVLSMSEPGSAVAQPDDIIITGSGWGDGVGLSQYGARAMADSGNSAISILGHYFQGAVVRDLGLLFIGSDFLADETPVWVGLLQDQNEVTFEIEEGMADLCFDSTGECAATIVAGEKWKFGLTGNGECAFSRQAGLGSWTGGYVVFPPSGDCSASVLPVSDPVTIRVPLKGRSYRSGTLHFRETPTSSGVHLVLQVGIDDYVSGIQEMPDFWPGAALEAQAIVSRTLAVRAVLDHGPVEQFDEERQELCACHIPDNSPDQVYGGFTAEQGHPFWQGRVGGTSGKVLTWNNEVITAKFSSSTGGSTESNEAVGGDPQPYLVSVDDSPSLSSVADNPFSSWTRKFSRDSLATTFGLDWVSDVSVASRNESESASTVSLKGVVAGKQVALTLSGGEVRDRLGLYSSYFDITVPAPFDDVMSDHPFAGEILGLVDLGITTGCTTTNYCPDLGVTREEMAAFLVRALDLDLSVGANSFNDDDGSVFEAEIETLHASGVTSGCTPTSFCPSDTVTREQMAAFITRAFELAVPAMPASQFTDSVGTQFEDEIEALYASDVTSGCGPTSYCPRGPVTRAEMAAFLVRALAVA